MGLLSLFSLAAFESLSFSHLFFHFSLFFFVNPILCVPFYHFSSSSPLFSLGPLVGTIQPAEKGLHRPLEREDAAAGNGLLESGDSNVGDLINNNSGTNGGSDRMQLAWSHRKKKKVGEILQGLLCELGRVLLKGHNGVKEGREDLLEQALGLQAGHVLVNDDGLDSLDSGLLQVTEKSQKKRSANDQISQKE